MSDLTNIQGNSVEVSKDSPVIGVCVNCKYFKPVFPTHGECNKAYVSFSEYSEKPELDSQLVVVDGQGALYNFKYYVARDFGCINFTSK